MNSAKANEAHVSCLAICLALWVAVASRFPAWMTLIYVAVIVLLNRSRVDNKNIFRSILVVTPLAQAIVPELLAAELTADYLMSAFYLIAIFYYWSSFYKDRLYLYRLLMGVSIVFIGLAGTRFLGPTANLIFSVETLCFFLSFTIVAPKRIKMSVALLFLLTMAVILLGNYIAGLQTSAPASEGRVLSLAGHYLFAYAVFVWFSRDCKASVVAALSFVLLMIIYFLSFLWVWFAKDEPRNINWIPLFPFFNNVRHMGMAVISAFIFCWTFSLFEKGLVKVLCLIGASIAAMLVIWSGGRGAALSMLSTGFVSAVYIYCKTNRVEYMNVIYMMGASFLLAFLFVVYRHDFGINAWFYKTTTQGLELEKVGSGRFDIWLYLWDLIKQRPVLGWGGDATRYLLSGFKGHNWVQAHNGLIQLLVEWGAAGLFAISIPFFYVVVKAKILLSKPEAVVGWALTLVLLVQSLTDGVFFFNHSLSYLAMSLGICFAFLSKRSSMTG